MSEATHGLKQGGKLFVYKEGPKDKMPNYAMRYEHPDQEPVHYYTNKHLATPALDYLKMAERQLKPEAVVFEQGSEHLQALYNQKK